MNALIVVACLAVVPAVFSSGVGTILKGPSGIVTDSGPIGPAELGIGPQVVAVPALGWGGIGLQSVGLGGIGLVQNGLGVITNGGGAIGIGHEGVVVRGPPTVPASIVGPSGKIVADGLWGPTLAVGKVW